MANRWETKETLIGCIFLGSNITADGDCNHEIKRCFLLERKAMTSLDSILKSRDITLLTKVHIVKAIAFLVVMCECDVRLRHDRQPRLGVGLVFRGNMIIWPPGASQSTCA